MRVWSVAVCGENLAKLFGRFKDTKWWGGPWRFGRTGHDTISMPARKSVSDSIALEVELQNRSSMTVEQTTRDSLNEDNVDNMGLMANIRNETHAAPAAEKITQSKRTKGTLADRQVHPFIHSEQTLYSESGNAPIGRLGEKSRKTIFDFMLPALFRRKSTDADYRHSQMYGNLNAVQAGAKEMSRRVERSIQAQNARIATKLQEENRLQVSKGIG